jgi:hypothetical protein
MYNEGAMTKEEIIAHQAREKKFREHSIGAAFEKFKAAYSRALIKDTESSFREDYNLRTVDDAWRKARDAEAELRKLLDQVCGLA